MANYKIREGRKGPDVMGLFLDDHPKAVKLYPGEVVDIPDDHPVFDSEASKYLERTRQHATRPIVYESGQDAEIAKKAHIFGRPAPKMKMAKKAA